MNYQYIVRRELTTKQVIERYESYSFPSFKQKSKARDLKEPFFAIEVAYDQEIVGLAIVELLRDMKILKILSLKVDENHQRHGIATQIMKIAEQIAKNNQISVANIIFQDNWDSFKTMSKLLNKVGWNAPEERLVMVKLHYNQVKDLPWFQIKDCPENFEIDKWLGLLPQDHEYIKYKKTTENWYPDVLSPFQLPHLVADVSSLVLKYKNQIVGWLIAHSIDNKTVQITSFFVDKEHRNTRASLAIIVQAVEGFYHAGIAEQAMFMFESSNSQMGTLIKKIAGENNTGAFTRVWVGQKAIQS